MKIISRSKERRARAVGPDEWFLVTVMEVEEADINRQLDHYLGMNHKAYTIRRSDVGRRIEQLSQSGYRSWCFCFTPTGA